MNPIGIVRIVVVDIAGVVHIEDIVGVGRIRRFVTKFSYFVSRPNGRAF